MIKRTSLDARITQFRNSIKEHVEQEILAEKIMDKVLFIDDLDGLNYMDATVSMSMSYFNYLNIIIEKSQVDDVIEKVLGPLHRKFGWFLGVKHRC